MWHPLHALLLALPLLQACLWRPPEGLNVVTAPDPSEVERYCAWYGDSDGRVLYVGLAPFWSAMRAADGDPTADLRAAGPQWIGRFDLARERWLPPLEVGPDDSLSGVWDVHLHDGQLYFTTFFDTAGRVDLATGEVVRFEAAGAGLNELADGPQGLLLVSRYGAGDGSKAGGELLALDPTGTPRRRWSLPAPPGLLPAPKTPAWSPVRRRLITTTDLLPEFEGETRHDAYTLEEDGAEWQRSAEPELQFAIATGDGVEYRAEVHADGRLFLRRVLPPDDAPDPAPHGPPEDARVLLDAEFPVEVDFVQDLKPAPGDRLVVTRWSGTVHVVEGDGSVETVRLPRLAPGGLYYTGVIRGDRLCVSHCAGVTVVCTDAP